MARISSNLKVGRSKTELVNISARSEKLSLNICKEFQMLLFSLGDGKLKLETETEVASRYKLLTLCREVTKKMVKFRTSAASATIMRYDNV